MEFDGYRSILRICGPESNPDNQLEVAIKEVLAHINIFDALRDSYDYADDIAGAVLVDWLGSALVFGCVAEAVWNGAHMLAIKARLVEDDAKEHGVSAVLFLLAAAAIFVIASLISMKSVISLISRPLVTAIHGFKPQDTPRFYDQDVAERNGKILQNVGDGLMAIHTALSNPQM